MILSNLESSKWALDSHLDLNLNPEHDHMIEKSPELNVLAEKLSYMNSQNKKVIEALGVICENYIDLHKKVIDLIVNNPSDSDNNIHNLDQCSRKRKLVEEGKDYRNIVNLIGICRSEIHHHHCDQFQSSYSTSSMSDNDREYKYWSSKRPKQNLKPKVVRVLVRTDPSDPSLVVSDGYHWRKYGQKVTKDNPSPRAYYKCSFSHSGCSVKKKVQRSVDDPSVLVATYEGDHNHTISSTTTARHFSLVSKD